MKHARSRGTAGPVPTHPRHPNRRLHGIVAAIAVLGACRELPFASNPGPPVDPAYSTIVLDRLVAGADVVPAWGAVSLSLERDQTMHIVSMDYWDDRVRYAGCASSCDDATRWLTGTVDSANPGQGFYSNLGGALTSGGVQAVYAVSEAPAPVLRLATCPGACQFSSNWHHSDLFPGYFADTQTRPLASDSSGALYLAYDAFAPPPPSGAWSPDGFRFAVCRAGCTSGAAWQSVSLDTVWHYGFSLAVTAAGVVHLLYAGDPYLRYATCAADCSVAGNWRSTVLDSGPVYVATLAAAGDGRLHAAYSRSDTVWYATCATACGTAGAWQRIPTGGRVGLRWYPGHGVPSLALAVAPAGSVTLVVDTTAVTVMQCAGDCLTAAGWRKTTVDSARGSGYAAVALDSAGHALIATTALSLQLTRMRH
jgi:hypothetical protein